MSEEFESVSKAKLTEVRESSKLNHILDLTKNAVKNFYKLHLDS